MSRTGCANSAWICEFLAPPRTMHRAVHLLVSTRLRTCSRSFHPPPFDSLFRSPPGFSLHPHLSIRRSRARPSALSDAVERRVDAMMSKLSLQQKLHLLGGDDSISGPGEPAIGLPVLKMSDGPLGVRPGAEHRLRAGINSRQLDTDLRPRGQMLGEDARAARLFSPRPRHEHLSHPQNGRNFEYFGEDPFLAGKIAAHTSSACRAKASAEWPSITRPTTLKSTAATPTPSSTSAPCAKSICPPLKPPSKKATSRPS